MVQIIEQIQQYIIKLVKQYTGSTQPKKMHHRSSHKNKRIQQLEHQPPSPSPNPPTLTPSILHPQWSALQKQQQQMRVQSYAIPKVVKKQYRNAMYVGSALSRDSIHGRNHDGTLRHGLGLLITDNNQIVFANWDHDRLYGQCVYISNQLRFFGKIANNDMFEGFHMIKVLNWSNSSNQAIISCTQLQQLAQLLQLQTTSSSNSSRNRTYTQTNFSRIQTNMKSNTNTNTKTNNNKNSLQLQPMTLFAIFKNNKIFGKCVVVIREFIYVCSLRIGNTPEDPSLSNKVKANYGSNSSNYKANTLIKSYRQKQFNQNFIKNNQTQTKLLSARTQNQVQNEQKQQPILYQYFQIQQKIKNSNRSELPNVLKQIFPFIKTFQLEEYLKNMIDSANAPQGDPYTAYDFNFDNKSSFNSNDIPLSMIVGQHEGLHMHIYNANKFKFGVNLSKYTPTMRKYPLQASTPTQNPPLDYKTFYGFSTHSITNVQTASQNTSHNKVDYQFGFVLYNQQLLSSGEHQHGQPHGLATVYEYPYYVHDGLFDLGTACGVGVRMDCRIGNRFVFGIFGFQDQYSSKNNLRHRYNVNTYKYFKKQANSPKFLTLNSKPSTNKSFHIYQAPSIEVRVLEQGKNWPNHIISKFKRQLHLRSVVFQHGYPEIRVSVPLLQMYRLCGDVIAGSDGVGVVEGRNEIGYSGQKYKNNVSQNRIETNRQSIFSNTQVKPKQQTKTKRRYTQASPSHRSEKQHSTGIKIRQFKLPPDNFGNNNTSEKVDNKKLYLQTSSSKKQTQMRQRIKTNPNVVTGQTNQQYFSGVNNRNSYNTYYTNYSRFNAQDDATGYTDSNLESTPNRRIFNNTQHDNRHNSKNQVISDYDANRVSFKRNNRIKTEDEGIKSSPFNSKKYQVQGKKNQASGTPKNESKSKNKKKLKIKVQQQAQQQSPDLNQQPNININIHKANINMIINSTKNKSHSNGFMYSDIGYIINSTNGYEGQFDSYVTVASQSPNLQTHIVSIHNSSSKHRSIDKTDRVNYNSNTKMHKIEQKKQYQSLYKHYLQTNSKGETVKTASLNANQKVDIDDVQMYNDRYQIRVKGYAGLNQNQEKRIISHGMVGGGLDQTQPTSRDNTKQGNQDVQQLKHDQNDLQFDPNKKQQNIIMNTSQNQIRINNQTDNNANTNTSSKKKQNRASLLKKLLNQQ